MFVSGSITLPNSDSVTVQIGNNGFGIQEIYYNSSFTNSEFGYNLELHGDSRIKLVTNRNVAITGLISDGSGSNQFSLIQGGTQTYTIGGNAGANTFSGGALIDMAPATLVLDKETALGTGEITLANLAQINLQHADALALSNSLVLDSLLTNINVFSNNFTISAWTIDGQSLSAGTYDNSSATFNGYDFSTRFLGDGSITVVPEPGTLALIGIALGSLVLFRRRK